MAQALLGAALPNIRVSSAGLGALIGSPADSLATSLMREIGLSIESHRAAQVTSLDVAGADLILTMESHQRWRLEELYRSAAGKSFRIGHYIDEDVPDPYGESEEVFRFSLDVIRRSIAQWLPRIKRLI